MIRIGNLTILPERREVYANGELVTLGARALDMLFVLLKANGALVTKSDLLREVWPTTVVEENNLHVHVSTLRKLLGDNRRLLVSVSGQGYRLLRSDASEDVARNDRLSTGIPPEQTSRTYGSHLFGREECIKQILEALEQHNVVTLVGTGGIGKTSLAQEVGRLSTGCYPGGVWMVELAQQTDPDAIPAAVASAMGFAIPRDSKATDAIFSLIGRDRTLLILDNCEHIIDAAADFVHRLILSNTLCKVLATSREALRIPEERQCNVEPLDVPGNEELGPSVLERGAVQLFLARARTVDPRFGSDMSALELIGQVCKRLDGIPLAIELAAARAAILGIRILAENIDARIQTLTGGYRDAHLPRHQTLKATFDWSYKLLSRVERLVLNRLAVLRGDFSLEDACAVAESEGIAAEHISEAIFALVNKSLVALDSAKPQTPYRLLETTRSYALQRLIDDGELNAAERRRALYLCHKFACMQDSAEARSVEDSLTEILRRFDNFRAALSWSFSATGDAALGRKLAALIVPSLFDLSLVTECVSWSAQALHAVTTDAASAAERGTTLRLLAAYASGLVYVEGPTEETLQTWAKVRDLAIAEREPWFEARALWGQWNWHQYGGRPRDALSNAIRFEELALRDGNEPHLILAQRIIGIAEHYCGNQLEAHDRIKRMLARYVHPIHGRDVVGVGINHRIVAQATVSRILLVKGRIDEARQLCIDTLDEAVTYDQGMTTAYVLVESVLPMSLLTNDCKLLRSAIGLLQNLLMRFGFEIWKKCGQCFSVLVALMDEYDDQLAARFDESTSEMCQTGYLAPLTLLRGMMATVFARAGMADKALVLLASALQHCETTGEYWYHPELSRIKAEILGQTNGSHSAPEEAESLLIAAIRLARKQGARLFEFRAAVSLAQLYKAQGRKRADCAFVQKIFDALPECGRDLNPDRFQELLETL